MEDDAEDAGDEEHAEQREEINCGGLGGDWRGMYKTLREEQDLLTQWYIYYSEAVLRSQNRPRHSRRAWDRRPTGMAWNAVPET